MLWWALPLGLAAWIGVAMLLGRWVAAGMGTDRQRDRCMR